MRLGPRPPLLTYLRCHNETLNPADLSALSPALKSIGSPRRMLMGIFSFFVIVLHFVSRFCPGLILEGALV